MSITPERESPTSSIAPPRTPTRHVRTSSRGNNVPYSRQRSPSRPRPPPIHLYPGAPISTHTQHYHASPAIGINLDPIGTPRYPLMPSGTLKRQMYHTLATHTTENHVQHGRSIPTPTSWEPGMQIPTHHLTTCEDAERGANNKKPDMNITTVNRREPRMGYSTTTPQDPSNFIYPRCSCQQNTDSTSPLPNRKDTRYVHGNDVWVTTYGRDVAKGDESTWKTNASIHPHYD